MSADVIGRRRAVEQRLARARTLAHSLEEATDALAVSSGQPIDQLDPDGSLRTALTALAGVAALRPSFDVMVALPGALFALRVLHTDGGDVEIEVLQRDGPEDTAGPPQPAQPQPAPARLDVVPQSADSAGSASSETDMVADLAAMLWQNVDQPLDHPADSHPFDNSASRTRETPR